MPFISQLLGKGVRDAVGTRTGILKDLVVDGHQPYPTVSAALISRPKGQTLAVSAPQIRALEPTDLSLNCTTSEIRPYPVSEEELLLARDIMDKQIIDTEGVKVVRVNDLQLDRVNGGYRLTGVDSTARGLLRRLGMEGLARLLRLPERSIKWEDVDFVPSGSPTVRLKVPRGQLAELHPADIAEIVHQLSIAEGSNAVASLDDETAARVAAEMDTDRQAAILEHMDSDRAADILDEMAPDDAADVLGELDKDRAQELIQLMEPQAAEDVQELIGYPEDSAGGTMTTDYLAFREADTAEQVIARLRDLAPDPETVNYLYVTDAEEHLVGVIPLRDLIVVKPQTRVGDFMVKRVISIESDTNQVEVAKILAKYNLMALPVVDAAGRLVGIVTIDDVMDVVLPQSWWRRRPKVAV